MADAKTPLDNVFNQTDDELIYLIRDMSNGKFTDLFKQMPEMHPRAYHVINLYYDELRRREQKRQTKQLVRITWIIGGVAIVTSLMQVFTGSVQAWYASHPVQNPAPPPIVVQVPTPMPAPTQPTPRPTRPGPGMKPPVKPHLELGGLTPQGFKKGLQSTTEMEILRH